jgi:hypothetical protein
MALVFLNLPQQNALAPSQPDSRHRLQSAPVFLLAGWHSPSDDPGREAEVQIHRL